MVRYSAKGQSYFDNIVERINTDSQKIIKNYKITNIYFGNEFCEELIPTLDEVIKAVDICNKLKYTFTLVTSYVTDKGIEKLEVILQFLDSLSEKIEVVCNDWGVCQLINDKYINLEIIAGRVLDKLSRDPRISKDEYELVYSKNSLEFLKTPNILVDSYQYVLKKYQVKRAEFDYVPQGLNITNKLKQKSVNKISVYMPFGYVTTGRMCMMRFLKQKGKEKFYLNKSCQKSCKKYNQIMVKNIELGINYDSYIVNDKLELFRKGNTVFYEVKDIGSFLEENDVIDRIVYQSYLPM